MALTIPHESKVGVATANAGQAAQYRNASAFMAPGQENTGRGMQQLGAGLGRLGGTLFDIELKDREEQIELELIEDVQRFQLESQAWTDNYRQSYQGKNALNAETDTHSFFSGKVGELHQKWNGNERAQLYIQQRAGGMMVSGVNGMRDYRDQQQKAWGDSVFAGKEATFKDIASDWRRKPNEVQAAYQDYAQENYNYLVKRGTDPKAALIQTDSVFREAMSKRTEQGFQENMNNKNLDEAGRFLRTMEDGDPANFVAQYESGTAGSLAIGYDKNGGTSYGKFQISSRAGTFSGFTQWLDKNGQGGVAKALRAAGDANEGGKEGGVPEAWQKLVRAGAITDEMQEQFIRETHIDPAMKGLPEHISQAIASDPTLSRALFSTAVQHGAGGAVKMFTRNWGKGEGNKETFLDALYDDRKGQFGSSAGEVQSGVAFRLDRERAALGAAAVSPERVAGYKKQFEGAVREKLKVDSIARLGGQFPESPEKASLAALQDPLLASDPKAQKAVTEYFNWQGKQQRAAEKQERLEAVSQSYEGVAAAAEKRDIQGINNIIMNALPEDMAKLQAYANRILNGDNLVSDPVAFDDMVSRISEGQRVSIEAEYGDSLSLGDLRRGKDMLAKRELAQYRIQEKAAFEEEAKWYKPKMKETERSALFRQFEAGIPAEGYKDPAQRQKALSAFWRKLVVDKPGMWTSAKEIRGFQEKEFAGKGYYPKKGEDYQRLVNAVREQIKLRDGVSREPTEEELARLYGHMQGAKMEGAK